MSASVAVPILATVAVVNASRVDALGPLLFMLGGYGAIFSFFIWIHWRDEREAKREIAARIERERIAEENVKEQLRARKVDVDRMKRQGSWSSMLAQLDWMNGPMLGTNQFGISKMELLREAYYPDPVLTHAKDEWSFDLDGRLVNLTVMKANSPRGDLQNES